MDYSKLADEVIGWVRWAVRKEDEQFGGEVLAERLQEALLEAGVPLVDEAWYGAPDDVFMALLLAFTEQEAMRDEEDPAISRIKSDLYNALEDRPELAESHPDFWARVTAAL